MRRPLGRARQKGDRDPIWFVTLNYAGERLRWASRVPTWDVLDVDGLPIALSGSWTPPDSISLSNDVSTVVEVVFPPGVGLAARELAGKVTLSGCMVEVAWLPRNGTWSDRCVAVTGVASDPEFGAANEPVIFGIVAPSQVPDTTVIPRATRAVTERTWPTTLTAGNPTGGAVESAQRLSYPIVYGEPGPFASGMGTVYGGATPTLIVESETKVVSSVDTRLASRLLVNWQPVPTGTTVYLRWQYGNDAHWQRKSFPVDISEDGLGQLCATIDITAESDAMRSAAAYFCSWYDGPADGRRGADEIVWWMLQRTSASVDLLRSRGGIGALRGLRMGGYIDAPTTPMDWIADRLAAFPVEMVDGPSGAYLSAIPWQARARDAVAHIHVAAPGSSDAASGAIRMSAVRVEARKASEVRVSWAPNVGGDGRMTTVVSGDGVVDTSTTVALAALQPAAGAPSILTVSVPDCWDEATAAYLARFLAWRDGTPTRTVRISVPTDDYSWLIRGDVVLYTDDELPISRMVSHVRDVGLTTDAMMELELELHPRR